MLLKYLIIGLVIAFIIGVTAGYILLRGNISTSNSNSNQTKAFFHTSPPPEEQNWFLYNYMPNHAGPYSITLVDNTTKPIYNVTIDYNMWLQFNNGSLVVDNYSLPATGNIQPSGSVYIDHWQIPTPSTQNNQFQIPANCTWI